VGHDTVLAWANDSSASVPQEELKDWSCRTHHTDDGHWRQFAKGPCPACHATVEGYTTDEKQEVPSSLDEVEAEPTVELPLVKVPVECNCGFDHGHEKATGCGRSWALICELESPKEGGA
jgi:hypothetical protein